MVVLCLTFTYLQMASSQLDVHWFGSHLCVCVNVYVVCVHWWIATNGEWMNEQETGTQGQCVICPATPGRCATRPEKHMCMCVCTLSTSLHMLQG